MLSRGVENAQKAIEGRNFGIRKNTLQYDEVMNEQRKTIYGERMKVLKGEDVHEQMLKYIPDYIERIVAETVNTDAMPEKWDEDALNAALKQKVYPEECDFEITREMLERWDYEMAINKITKEVIKAYEQKIVNIAELTDGVIDYRQIERNELLRSVDRNWIDHIDAMDQLRKGIGLRGYAQQDPVLIYKQEGFDMFEEMIERVQMTTISRLLKGRIERVPSSRPVPVKMMQAPEKREIDHVPSGIAEQARRVREQRTRELEQQLAAQQAAQRSAENSKNLTPSAAVTPAANSDKGPVIGDAPQPPQNLTANIGGKQIPSAAPKTAKVGRNDPCPCGSGKKYKDCCYWKDHK